MTTDFPGYGAPLEPRALDVDDPYVLWDAAYVMGSLSSTERREYEGHLAGCKRCRTAVSELSGMPALLALLDRDEMCRVEELPAPPPLRPEVLTSLLDKVRWRRRRSRWVTWTASAAAAVVLALGVFVAMRPGSVLPVPPQTRMSADAMTMAPVVPSELDATIALSSHGWGTRVEMTCTYHQQAFGGRDDDAGDKLAMVVVGRDGSHTQLATWMALPAVTALPTGSTSMPIDEIAAVQVVSADTGDVLLQQTL